MTARVLHGDCLQVMRELPNGSVDAVVTDPPYGLSNTTPAQVAEALTRWLAGDRDYTPAGRGFMGKSWDAFVPPPAVWDECLRVLRPGGHLLAFAGTRTVGLMETSIRLAAFDIRPGIAWLYATGMVKAPGQLKPSFEPVVVARAPFTSTAKANMAARGVGLLRVEDVREAGGRVPTDVLLDAYAADGLDEQTGNLSVNGPATYRRDKDDADRTASSYAVERGAGDLRPGYGDSGGASRFFPTFREQETTWASGSVTSASGADTTSAPGTSTTTTGMQSLRPSASSAPVTTTDWPFRYQAKAPTRERPSYEREDGTRVAHPTVKPVELMRWLVRLVTPPGGTVLDPFAGSGATVEAALLEGLNVTAIEREGDYLPLIEQRIDRVTVRREAA